MARTTIDVTQEDIDKALKCDSAKCVVAQAVARTFPKATSIRVDTHGIRFTNGDRRFTYLTPPAVAEYIVAFDAGDELHPFRFTLRDEQRLVVRRQKRTSASSAEHSARSAVAYAAKKAAAVETDPSATTAQRTVAHEKLAAAEARLRVARAEAEASGPARPVEDLTDVPPMQREPRGGRRTVFKSNKRSYGGRLMRINNDPGPGVFHGPLDIEDDDDMPSMIDEATS